MSGSNGEDFNNRLTPVSKNDIIKEADKSSGGSQKSGLLKLLCDNNDSCHCLSLGYEPITSADGENRISCTMSFVRHGCAGRRVHHPFACSLEDFRANMFDTVRLAVG